MTDVKIIRIDRTQGDLVFHLFNQYRIFYKQPSDTGLAKEFIQQRLGNDESVIFVALANKESMPIGFTQLYPAWSSVRVSKYWILNDLFVDPEYRKRGIGEALISTVLNFARESKARIVELSTAVDNFTAQKLYEQIGFERQKPDTGFYTYRINIPLT